MSIQNLRSTQFEKLADEHFYFKLQPFLSENISECVLPITDNAESKIRYFFKNSTLQLTEQPDWYWSCRARAYLMDIINYIESVYYHFNLKIDDDTNEPSAEFSDILSYINNNLENSVTLDLLSKNFFICKNRIENMFKNYLNTSFHNYLKAKRLEKINYYLRFTSLPYGEIAFKTGYSSSQNLCRFFKYMTGTTPDSFRKEAVRLRNLSSKF